MADDEKSNASRGGGRRAVAGVGVLALLFAGGVFGLCRGRAGETEARAQLDKAVSVGHVCGHYSLWFVAQKRESPDEEASYEAAVLDRDLAGHNARSLARETRELQRSSVSCLMAVAGDDSTLVALDEAAGDGCLAYREMTQAERESLPATLPVSQLCAATPSRSDFVARCLWLANANAPAKPVTAAVLFGMASALAEDALDEADTAAGIRGLDSVETRLSNAFSAFFSLDIGLVDDRLGLLTAFKTGRKTGEALTRPPIDEWITHVHFAGGDSPTPSSM